MAENERYFNPSVGNFALAYLEHGTKPTGASCTYTIVVNTNSQLRQTFADSMKDPSNAPYRILQQDARAHLLHDRASNTTGYVLFAANDSLPPDDCTLMSNSHPCFVMIRKREADLAISLANTDIELKKPVTLILRGKWRANGDLPEWASIEHPTNATTRLTVAPDYYMPVQLALR